MIELICKYCEGKFKTVSSLNLHQKKTKYCLIIQGKINIKEHKDKEFKCEYCDKILASKQNLQNHIKKCGTIKDKTEFICIYCTKILSSNKNLSAHHITCDEKKIKDMEILLQEKDIKIRQNENLKIQNKNYKEQIEKQEEQIKVLNQTIEKLSFRAIDNQIVHNIRIPKDMILNLNGFSIISRKEDGYVNLTALCKAGGKDFNEWNRNKKTKAFLQALSSFMGIPVDELIVYTSGSIHERSSWGHPQVAVNIAQWISAEFDVQVSKWIYQLALNGTVDLKNEKTTKELDDIYTNKRLSLDIQSYLDKEVLYIFEFKPEPKYMQIPELLEDKNIHYFEFGITSNILQRQKQYGQKYRLDRVFEYDTRTKLSLAEGYVKKIVYDMGLKFIYRSKIECVYATYKQLEDICKLISEHNSKSKNFEKIENDNNEYIFELEKLQIQKEIEKIKHNTEFIKMMKDSSITFEQFKEYIQ